MAGLKSSLTNFSKNLKSGISANISRNLNKLKNFFSSYDLYKEIKNHPWAKKGNPSAYAVNWYRNEIMTNEKLWLIGKFLVQGKLYIYDYTEPKYKDTLPWFDEQPLVLSLGSVETSLGRRDIGLNLHLLPPITRRIVISQIFLMYKNRYKGQLYLNNQASVQVEYSKLIQPLEKYGVLFCVRMYIPNLRKNTIEFLYEDWKSAIYLESKKLNSITVEALEKEWKIFVNKNKNLQLNGTWKTS